MITGQFDPGDAFIAGLTMQTLVQTGRVKDPETAKRLERVATELLRASNRSAVAK